MSKKLVLIGALVALAVPAGPAVAQAQPWGSGTVSVYRVGPLRFGVSTLRNLWKFAGKGYSSMQDQTSDGAHVPLNVDSAKFRIVEYGRKGLSWSRPGYVDYIFWWQAWSGPGCPENGCGRWVFTQFITSLQRFHTAQGITVGMTQAKAHGLAHRPFSGGCVGGGFWGQAGLNGDLADIGYHSQRVDYLMAWGKNQLLC